MNKTLQIITLSILFIFQAGNIKAQNGTYEKKNSNGSYCYISLQKNGNHVKAEIFAWWNNANAQTGSYYGEGQLKGNTCVLKSTENEPDCNVSLSLTSADIKASFSNCAVDHLTADFNGTFKKITDATAGGYVVTATRSYFHKKADPASKLKTYVLKGDKVTLNMDRIKAGNWVSVYYTSPSGKETEGYLLLADLKKLN